MVATNKKYSAPALEKGLDILELLSKDLTPITVSGIAEKLSRSNAEIYRMILVLEQRGYIEKDGESEGYRITRKILQLATEQEPIKDILEFASPIIRQLADKTSMSCHISVQSHEQIVVLNRAEPAANMSYSVRVGFRCPLICSAEGQLFFAYQSDSQKEEMLAQLSNLHEKEDVSKFLRECKKASKQGYVKVQSSFMKGVTDISFPILDGNFIVASITIPFVQRLPESLSIDRVTEELRKAADDISKAISFGFVRQF
ncbi:IclR family transcriptional regulator [Thalassotalea sp. PS06]|uniref:IclR family transcriptional regulator n=1 Tax=Thalassotalea sp. PS06 TaxID=2594005 RepID=UPI0011629F2D|nr:IclR family transcriptional regulator [Thalassotalea sp. PS06]QDP01679.1 IclR family transcriptional regulator [Thalassotalea sp. PS06]